MKQGWVLIVLGIAGAVYLQHSDAIVAGVCAVLFGAWILSLKEKV